MIKAVLWSLRISGFLALLALPWWWAAWLYQPDKVVWECHMAFEMARKEPEQILVRSMGNYSQFFYGNATGIARLSGRNEHCASSELPKVSTVHRLVDFSYKQAGPYLKKTITAMSRKRGDTAASDQHRVFSTAQGDEVYMQVFKLGPSTYAFGRLGMPRQVCEGRQGWLSPKVR